MGLRRRAAAAIATALPLLGVVLGPADAPTHATPVLTGFAVPPPAPRPEAATASHAIEDVTLAAATAPEPTSDDRCRGGAVLYRGDATRPRVALSFDDGPSPTVTPGVLEVLREHGVRATFFVLGEPADRYPDTLRAIVAAGHELGNHGWSHTSFRSMFPSQIEGELDRTADRIEAVGGARPRLVRPPFGRFPASSVALAAKRGEDFVLWSVDGGDTEANDAERSDALGIANAVVRGAEPGAIVLLHDRNPATLRALPLILGGLERKGLQVVPVSELLALDCAR
jgi:peptidoglycan/xylan/chitin deacetylase (PgdA/CDA1 family)